MGDVTGPDPDATEAAQRLLAGVADEWMGRPGVISVEVARRRLDGVPTDEVGIRVTVEHKRPASAVPESELFPDDLQGVPVDVVEGRAPQLEA
jgi:hypothetical protein